MRIISHKHPFLPILSVWIGGLLCADRFCLPVGWFCALLPPAALLLFLLRKRMAADLLLFLLLFLCSVAFNGSFRSFAPEAGAKLRVKCCCEEELPHNNYIISAAGRKFHLTNGGSRRFNPGDSLTFTGRCYPLNDISNSHAFSYSRYLKQKGIHHRIVAQDSIIICGSSPTLYARFQHLRRQLVKKSDRLIIHPQINAVVKAVGLGYKNDLEAGTKQLFSETGTIHLLAVSGLHMGAVFYILTTLLRLFRITQKNLSLILIPLLWSYACLTGLSPSVVRAAQILSFVIVGKVFAKEFSPINCVAASALFTLLADRYAIHSLSMQMSYAAYTGIILFYPFLRRWADKLPRGLGNLCAPACVTLSAQLLTLPLSAYYFHQFSITSVLVNLLAIPLTSFLLYLYLLLLALPILVGAAIVPIVVGVGQAIFFLLERFSAINWSIAGLYPDGMQIILLYACGFLFFRLFIRREKHILWITATASLMLVGYGSQHNFLIQTRREIILFHLYGDHCILLNNRGHYALLLPPQDTTKRTQYMPYVNGNRLRHAHPPSLPPNYTLASARDTITVITQAINSPPFPTGRLIISGPLSPQAFANAQGPFPREVITDGATPKPSVERWRTFCETHQIPFSSTHTSGSITIPF